MIELEAISTKFAEFATAHFARSYWDDDERTAVAAFLDAAIEAGLVSPPVYLVVDNRGDALIDNLLGIPVCFPSAELAEARAAKTWMMLPKIVHYKGGLS